MDADGLLDRLVTRVSGLGLTWEGTPLSVAQGNVGKRKVPVAQESLNDPPQLAVSKSQRPEQVRRWATGYDLTAYFFRLELVTAGEHDMKARLPEHAQLRKALLGTFAHKATAGLGDVAGLQDVLSRPDDFLPPGRIERGYDTQAVEVEVRVVETRGATS